MNFAVVKNKGFYVVVFLTLIAIFEVMQLDSHTLYHVILQYEHFVSVEQSFLKKSRLAVCV